METAVEYGYTDTEIKLEMCLKTGLHFQAEQEKLRWCKKDQNFDPTCM